MISSVIQLILFLGRVQIFWINAKIYLFSINSFLAGNSYHILEFRKQWLCKTPRNLSAEARFRHLCWSFFLKTVNRFKPLSIFAKSSTIVVWEGPRCAPITTSEIMNQPSGRYFQQSNHFSIKQWLHEPCIVYPKCTNCYKSTVTTDKPTHDTISFFKYITTYIGFHKTKKDKHKIHRIMLYLM